MSFYKTTFYVGIAALILMAVNSHAITKVQQWVTHLSVNHYGGQTFSSSPILTSTAKRTSTSVIRISSNRQLTNSLNADALADTVVQTTERLLEQSPKPILSTSIFPISGQKNIELVAVQKVVSTNQPVTTNRQTPPHDLQRAKVASEEKMDSGLNMPEWVIYPNEIVIAFPKKIASTENVQKAVSQVLLSKTPFAESNLLKTQKIDLKQRPYFYRKVLDQNQAPIRYPMQAYHYADYLMEHNAEEHQDEEGQYITLHIPLVEYGISGPAKNYQAWVESYAKEFKVPPSLVYAVMETESAFNPNAVSRSNAIGLMQVKADAAGKDVYRYIDSKPGQPSLAELFDSKSNIRMGTAYLGLLKHDYLAAIKDDRIKQMVTISSYNGGMRTVLELFGATPEHATQQLNRMSPKQVYRKLRFEHQSDETRRYLEKVLKAESKYRDLLKAA